MAHVVQEKREYQRILHSDKSIEKLERNGFEWVYSSNVSAAAVRGKDLIIRFHNASIYKYPNQGKNYERLMGAASKGKWVWRFLRRPNKPYSKIGSLPLPEDIDRDDEEIFKPKPPKYRVETIVPANYMETGALPQIRIVPIEQAQDVALTADVKFVQSALNPTVVKVVEVDVFKPDDFIKPSAEIRVEQAKKWFTKPEKAKQAVNNYTTNDYEIYNGYLRGDKDITEFLDDNVKKMLDTDIKLMKEITDNELGHDMKLYRNIYTIDDNFIDKEILNAIPKDMKQGFIDYLNKSQADIGNVTAKDKLYNNLMSTMKGTTFKDKGFSSSTMSEELSESTDFGSIKLNIFAPKKTKGAIIETLTKAKNEDEVLLNAGTEFEILDIRKDDSQFNLILDVKVKV